MNLSEKTVERLIRCRRELLKYQYLEKPHVFSNDLARVLNIRPEQLRQDLMATGIVAGSNRNGYDVNKLIAAIEAKTDLQKIGNTAFIGDVKLVDVFKNFIDSDFFDFEISAVFSFTAQENTHLGVPWYSMEKMPEIITNSNIEIAIVGVCPDFAQELVDTLLLCGIKGIINLTSENILPVPGIRVENYDILAVIEKINFLMKRDQEIETIIKKNSRNES
jgi:redox-sensing transcriptional repressor